MLILVIEDDEYKRTQICNFVSQSCAFADLRVAKSLQSGLRAIISERFDLIILDMTMPTFDIGFNEDGGRPQAYAGREILRQLDRRKIKIPVVVVTQFDRFGSGDDALTLEQLDSELSEAHPDNYKGSVYYNASVEGWKDSLANTIRQSLNKEVAH
jgi:CheY-like chemotaxis protein